MHPEADLYIDNHLGDYGAEYHERLGLQGEILHDPSDEELASKLETINTDEVELLSSLQGTYSLSKIGKIVSYLQRHSRKVIIKIEPIPESIRFLVGAPAIELHEPMDTLNTNTRKLRVFLCHAKSDEQKVRKLHLQLTERGVEPWLDEESLLPGQDWNEEIRKAIKNSHIILACLSNASITKTGYVQKEIRFALDFADEQPEGTVYIVPVKLEECKVPTRLSRWQWVELYKKGGMDKLSQTLSKRAREVRESGQS